MKKIGNGEILTALDINERLTELSVYKNVLTDLIESLIDKLFITICAERRSPLVKNKSSFIWK